VTDGWKFIFNHHHWIEAISLHFISRAGLLEIPSKDAELRKMAEKATETTVARIPSIGVFYIPLCWGW
tara:strand:+ start:518 stop:721 length:204 start_codon:yes stop_codon:yes gene_type:complete